MNILCRLGLHKPDKEHFMVMHKRKGQHRWHTNYKVIRSYLYDAYHHAGPSEVKGRLAAAIKDLVIAKVMYEKHEKERRGENAAD